MIERQIAWMDVQDAGEKGSRVTVWDHDGPGRVKVGVEIHYDEDGRLVHFLASSEDNAVLDAEQNPGEDHGG
jgi:hypothetical protein